MMLLAAVSLNSSCTPFFLYYDYSIHGIREHVLECNRYISSLYFRVSKSGRIKNRNGKVGSGFQFPLLDGTITFTDVSCS